MKKYLIVSLFAIVANIQSIYAQSTDVMQLPKISDLGIAKLKRIDIVRDGNDRWEFSYNNDRLSAWKKTYDSGGEILTVTENPLNLWCKHLDGDESYYYKFKYNTKENRVDYFDEHDESDYGSITLDDKNQMTDYHTIYLGDGGSIGGNIGNGGIDWSYHYTWEDGNISIVDMKFIEEYNGKQDICTRASYITYTDKDNSGLFFSKNLYHKFYHSYLGPLFYSGIMGTPIKKLPSKILEIDSDGYKFTSTFSYEFDSQGRVYIITENIVDDYSSWKETYTETYIFVYDDSPSSIESIQQDNILDSVKKTTNGIIRINGNNAEVYDYSGNRIK